jgi:hypothetical protein
MSNSLRLSKLGLAALLLCSSLTGCWERRTGLSYLGEESNQYYRDFASSIEFPAETQETPEQVVASTKPRTINDRSNDEVWEMPLSEAIVTAIENNRVIRSDATFLTRGNALYTNPDRIGSVYDPAIQESGFLFGGRGVEAALAAFDARWDTRMLWGRNATYNNSIFESGALGAPVAGTASTAETANFDTSLTKAFAYGGQVTLNHNVDYLGSNRQGLLFPSAYRGSVSAEYRQPLLAGAGAEFTRVAGPITQSFGGITGVSQGVLIARINNDITIADLENNVRNLVLDVENLYWDLYLAYVNYDTAAQTRASARKTWHDLLIRKKILNNEPLDEDERLMLLPEELEMFENDIQLTQNLQVNQPVDDVIGGEKQARDAYFASRVAVERALSQIYTAENRLRRLLGLQVNDGRIIRPQDEPLTAEYIPDWYDAIADGLTNRVELRRQKWNIKSLELQLTAAKSLTRPRLDFVTSGRINGLGDDLFGTDRGDGISNEGLDNLYGNLAGAGTSGWTAGVELSIPVGFRQAHAQVRNYELRLAKAREVLSVQEMEISHEIAASMQELALAHQVMETLYNRRIAAQEFVNHEAEKQKVEKGSTDLLLRAIANRAEADLAYYEALVQYNQALATFQYRKGTLLEYNNVYLAEDHWDPAAYNDALRRAQERGHAIENNLSEAKPEPFALPANPQPIELRLPADDTDLPLPLPEEEQLPAVPEEEAVPAPPPADEAKTRPYDETPVSAEPQRETLSLRPVPDSDLLSRLKTQTLTRPMQRHPQSQPTPKPATLQTVSHESAAAETGLRNSTVSVPPVTRMTRAFGNEPVQSSESRPLTSTSSQTSPQRAPLPEWPGAANQARPAEVQKPSNPSPRSQARQTEIESDDDDGEWYPLD